MTGRQRPRSPRAADSSTRGHLVGPDRRTGTKPALRRIRAVIPSKVALAHAISQR
jgi:hypothetical protein